MGIYFDCGPFYLIKLQAHTWIEKYCRATFITNVSMTRSELIERISRQYPKLTQADVASAVAVILDAITATLVANDRVEVRDFGSFSVNYRPARVGRNPKTGEKVDVPAWYAPHFKPGKALRERVELNK